MSLSSQVITGRTTVSGSLRQKTSLCSAHKGFSDFWLQALKAAYWLAVSNSLDLCKLEPTTSDLKWESLFLKSDGDDVKKGIPGIDDYSLSFLAVLCGVRHFGSLTRDQTHVPCGGAGSLNHRITSKVPDCSVFNVVGFPENYKAATALNKTSDSIPFLRDFLPCN